MIFDFVLSISFHIGFFILIAFFLWILSDRFKSSVLDVFFATYRCTYCAHIFDDFKDKKILSCPQCDSLIDGKDEEF